MRKKLTGIILSALLVMFVLSACDLRPLSIGFGGRIGRTDPILGAVKSNRRIFDIDDVTLDFYFGYSGYGSLNEETDTYKTVGLALYFCNEEGYKSFDVNALYEDYRNIEEQCFIKLIGAEEFDSIEYQVNTNLLRTKYNHCERFTVPAEILVQDNDHFCLAFLYITLNKEQQKYYILPYCLALKYEIINYQQVRISEPDHSF